MATNSLSITDNRTGKKYEIPIADGTVRAQELRKIKTDEDDFGLMTYDPGFSNTACCRSEITFIDGDKGILWYRGYSIDRLAEECSFLEVAYLLLHGDLPGEKEGAGWSRGVLRHTLVHEKMKDLLRAFHYDASPMSILQSSVGALGAFYPEARNVGDPEVRRTQVLRLLAKMPTLAAFAYRHRRGLPFVGPSNRLSFPANFLTMMFQMADDPYEVHPVLERAIDILFVLHADHEQNCSTNTMRGIGSSRPDPYAAAAGAIAALAGPLHGGANEAVLRMLERIGSKDRVPEYIKRVKNGEFRLMGFGHRVYKNYDPRAKIIKKLADDVFEVTGTNPLLDVALELERIALEDDYFVKRRLYPNVDFYSGLIYEAMGFPTSMFPVLFAVARTAGWLAQWEELLNDSEQKIARPRQIYSGKPRREMPARSASLAE